MAQGSLEEPVSRPRQSAGRWIRKSAWLEVPHALLGELGHQLLERLGQALAHHFFHIVFGLGAALIFGVYVLIDVRSNGWPTFSWRIRPPQEPQPAPRP
jgi:hypothetical protein